MAKKRTAEPELAIEPVTLTPREVMKYGQPTVRLATPKQVARLMARTISQVRRGELGWREASAIAACARIALSAIASSASDDELNKLGGAKVRVRRIIEIATEDKSAKEERDTEEVLRKHPDDKIGTPRADEAYKLSG